MRGSPILAAALAMSSLFPAQSAAADEDAARLHLGELRLHLLYRDSGRLSPDLLHGDGPRATWNLTIGGSDLGGPADDALAVLPIRADKDAKGDGEVFSNVPITIRALNQRGKVLAQRRIAGVLTTNAGEAYLALWLPDVTCEGPLTIEATLGRERATGQFDFRCGE